MTAFAASLDTVFPAAPRHVEYGKDNIAQNSRRINREWKKIVESTGSGR